MLRSLWLPSWYPSNASSQNGDFIQRHAYAASEFAKVDVIYVVPYTTNETDFQHSNNLTEKLFIIIRETILCLTELFHLLDIFCCIKKH